jgi:hypothetical protein
MLEKSVYSYKKGSIDSEFSTFPSKKIVASHATQTTETVLAQIDSTVAVSQQLSEVRRLQSYWDSAMGGTTAPDVLLSANYNPVLARWNWEQSPNKESFREKELHNIVTALRERNQTAESRLTFTIDAQGNIRNEMFPNEPYEQMLARGVAYREHHGSTELARERAEIAGFHRRQKIFVDPQTPLGTKFITISPPGLAEDSIYTHNFVDVYALTQDKNGDRVIDYTRFSSDLDYDEYAVLAKKQDPTFFIRKELAEQSGNDEIPLDAWYLSNPLLVSSDTAFDELIDAQAMDEQEWQVLWNMYMPFAFHLLDMLTKDDFDPVAIAEAYNTMLHSGENKNLQQKMRETTVFVSPQSTQLTDTMRSQIASMVRQFGRKEVEEKKVGCGSSGGITFGKDTLSLISDASSTARILQNSVAQFGIGNGGSDTQEWFTCPKCRYKADGPVGNQCPGCGLTKEQYVEETGVSCD